MSTSVDILFLDSQDLGQPGSLEQICQVFTDCGFVLNQLSVKDNIPIEEAGQEMSTIFSRAYHACNLSFPAFHPGWNIEVFQQIAWGEQQMGAKDRAYISTSTQSTKFWREGNNNLQYCSFLIDIGQKLYYVLKPTFGWIDLYPGWTTTHEDIELRHLQYLYWANFFGPTFVEKLGRGKIRNAPAWKIKELTDGGILYLLAPHLGLTDEHVPIADVKRYFGIENVR